ncbi:HetZ-related protein 2 [Gloeocapsopsis dulcis]|uniref:Uncharacterized protein n=1 Tax=Gloeocapsopsis dulcis AAB1 = 1H9 TaxID=1433147 RepID=A0A6N8G1Z2_9CHRO|nr:HetZ-related protein 2 [Gloeocapsopsis dulcis]MUL38186.1 hypothetical protein [Gloeocapsopsis dulcis AAB1 = 1H9]WNN90782.1 HetZ-related protein 2 [Gloeocapsopsis dulcis]
MQTLEQIFEEDNLMIKWTENLTQSWRSRLCCELQQYAEATQESILRWLIGNDMERIETMLPHELDLVQQGMEYRYCILLQRYLGQMPEQAYRNLTTRLSGLVILRNKIWTWVSLSRDRTTTVLDVLQEVIQELLQSDRYMQQQINWIAQCTNDVKLRNALLFASLEEYSLRRIRNQPLIAYRFVNYLRRTSRGGLTQVPTQDLVKLVSEDILTEDNDNPVSLFDTPAIAEYQDRQAFIEQQSLRIKVQKEFEAYLSQKLGATAVKWLQLYLQGKSQEAIAHHLNLQVKEVYRLREKISYHAVRVFAAKEQTELVGHWLENSLQEHSFGLTPQQWQHYWAKLTPKQCQLVELLKEGKDTAAIAQTMCLQPHQVLGEWTKLYLVAQTIRSQD